MLLCQSPPEEDNFKMEDRKFFLLTLETFRRMTDRSKIMGKYFQKVRILQQTVSTLDCNHLAMEE